jgi:hypothetical protein
MSSNVRFLTIEEFNIFFTDLYKEYDRILYIRYKMSNSKDDPERIILSRLAKLNDLKNEITRLIQRKDIYKKIIIEKEKNNYKYTLFIKLFRSVIDGMIKNDALNTNGKEYNKYINNKINERKNDLNNQPFLDKSQLRLFYKDLTNKYTELLRERHTSNKNISDILVILNGKLKDEILKSIQEQIKYRKIIINKKRNNENSNGKYNSLIDMFSRVIDNLIVNGKLQEYPNNNR